MRQTALTQSGVPGRVIDWTNSLLLILLVLVGVELPLCLVATLS